MSAADDDGDLFLARLQDAEGLFVAETGMSLSEKAALAVIHIY
jgi:hypothetical protein